MKHQITISIDDDMLASYTDERLATCWHVAQANPASINDELAGELAERVGREIIRRWLRATPPALWNHQGRHHYQQELSRFAKYEPGGPADDQVAFHSGRWVSRQDADAVRIAVCRADLHAVTRALADHEWSDFADAATEAAYRRLAADADAS